MAYNIKDPGADRIIREDRVPLSGVAGVLGSAFSGEGRVGQTTNGWQSDDRIIGRPWLPASSIARAGRPIRGLFEEGGADQPDVGNMPTTSVRR